MKFGLFLELSVPRPATREAEARVFRHSIEDAVLADQLGFNHVWVVEHHFLEEYSHSGAPEVLLGAIAAKTQRIRLGHGVVVCVPQINHPVRVAERIAVLDIISDGRVDFGTGRSSTWTELGGFYADPDATKQSWSEYVDVIPRMWSTPVFSHEGVTFSLPERKILPRPVQLPHPPMWVAVSSPGTEIDAAVRGLGWLGVNFSGYEALAARIRKYREITAKLELEPFRSKNDTVYTVNFLYCHEDAEYAAVRGGKLATEFQYLADQNLHTREVVVTPAYPTLGGIPTVSQRDTGSEKDKGVPEGACVGTPEQIIDTIERWRAIGVDGINFIINSAEVLDADEVRQSLHLFAGKVLPHLSRDAASMIGALGATRWRECK
jgi:alkanesulfonate monooxygenase SsuD/methylene tetrahydromethanopterin reductase-like flavin-dependent oxidoreductase (luciferase family)